MMARHFREFIPERCDRGRPIRAPRYRPCWQYREFRPESLGRLPYGAEVAKAKTLSAQRKLHYASVLDAEREIPAWIDAVLERALHPNPLRRYEALSEYVQDLRRPNQAFLSRTRAPLAERHPVRFWKGVSAVLAVIVVVLLFARFGLK